MRAKAWSKLFRTAALVLALGLALPVQSTNVANAAAKRSKPVTISLSANRAVYQPNDSVRIDIRVSNLLKADSKTASVTVYHLSEKLSTSVVKLSAKGTASFDWRAPAQDFTGYLISVTAAKVPAAIGVDVSSDWARFPRYGFLSSFGQMTLSQQAAVIENLNRFHINAVQFYDWQDSHSQPLAVTGNVPALTWNDIANRPTLFTTVNNYISLAHAKGMKAMNYNLINGSYELGLAPGVKAEWGLFENPDHSSPAKHPLKGWESDLYLQNPGNQQWRDYLIGQEEQVQKFLKFDGWHVDQLGDRGLLYDYSGMPVQYRDGFTGFLSQAKSRLGYDLVMNAVDGFGQEQILQSKAVKIAYNEVWSSKTFAQLKAVIDDNYKKTAGGLSTVLAAYVNRGESDVKGNSFNPHSVLLTDALIFASGGSHIELGEHLLGNEYFPNNNLAMSSKLKNKLISYYDFATAYQNLLSRTGPDTTDTGMYISSKVGYSDVPKAGCIHAFSKTVPGHLVTHLINLTGAPTNEWRDDSGLFTAPVVQKNVVVTLHTDKTVKNVWLASPDASSIAPVKTKFVQVGNTVKVTVPSLNYWSMVVMDF